jgi:hypothetical protein
MPMLFKIQLIQINRKEREQARLMQEHLPGQQPLRSVRLNLGSALERQPEGAAHWPRMP